MDIFNLRERVIREYQQFIESFLHIKDERINNYVHNQLKSGMLWPDELIQLSPSYEMGKSVPELVAEKVLHPLCERIFRKDGKPIRLYKHQEEAIRIAMRKEPYVLTTGTGSGKSLTYLIPIIDHILKFDPEPEKVRAIIVYPMNALINSQEDSIAKLLKNLGDNQRQIRFARYTGQENQDVREYLRQHPPHILLTNYVMLELMMSRPTERIFLESTLANLEVLVFDELHTYTGRRGADVAMLIRRVRQRCGNDDLLCIGTSATMATGESRDEEQRDVAEVASKIFGVDISFQNVIDESVRRTFNAPGKLTPELLRQAVEKAVPNSYDTFMASPLAAWIEDRFGLEERAGFLKRTTPITIRQGADYLAKDSDVDVDTCIQKITGYLLKGSEIRNEEGDPLYALRLHQFISQGDSVYATLESPASRQFTLTGQVFATTTGHGDRLFVPLAFCRECGQEYYQVTYWSHHDKIEPRAWYDNEILETPGVEEGYLLVDDGDEPLWSDDRLSELPDTWFRETKSGISIVANYRDFLPQRKYVAPDGSLYDEPGDDRVPAWFLKLPFLICPVCGAVYDKRTSEFRKLSRLSSEGRSTATTLLTLTTVRELLKEPDVPANARKILSFTDNRQDASLQTGHFNDFVQVALIRNAIYRALPADGYLTHDVIASNVVDALALPADVYAKNPGQLGIMARKNREALVAFIEYHLYRDLSRGWRIVQPNLEQCGLLQIDYEGLQELCMEDTVWEQNEILSSADGKTRFIAIRAFLDHLRRSMALNVNCLKANYLETLKRKVNETLKGPWCFDENEQLMESEWFRYGNSLKGKFSLASNSLIGRYLRSVRAWPALEKRIPTNEYDELVRTLVDTLQSAGYLYLEEKNDDYRIQLNVISLQWKKGDGLSERIDPIRRMHLKNELQDTDYIQEANQYFTKFYTDKAQNLHTFESREHTGQTNKEDREKREDRFRSGELSTLFCSPTMELGIDIEDLVTVNMRNVPPTPANYAQRSGRAGRAKQPAFISTYCSMGSGHDQYFFRKRQKMVAGKVIPPRLELDNMELIQSHVHAIWLSVVNLHLSDSIADILDLSVPELPLNPNISHQIRLSPARMDHCLTLCHKVLSQCRSDLEDSLWYSEDWLCTILNQAPDEFDRSFDRWRELYRSAEKQLEDAQTKIREADRLRLSYKEQQRLQRLVQESMRQRILLCNRTKQSEDSDFYPYRYLASEGFLPGYNFPRLPIRAYIPGVKDGTYLSRSRFQAINEYGPRNIIYHEGQKYRVVKSILPPGEIESLFTHAKICESCSSIHVGSDSRVDICTNCKGSLDGENSRYFDYLFRMTSVETQPWEKINCNEEERLRKGFDVRTHFRYAEIDGAKQYIRAETFDASGKAMLDIIYGPSAHLWRINLGWRKRNDFGFKLGMNFGIWDKQESDENDTALDADKHHVRNAVYPYVTDTRNILLIRWVEDETELGATGLINLQYALHRGLCAAFNIDENEIESERIGKGNQVSILIWEAAEGGVGVLHRIIDEGDAISTIALNALEICHFDHDSGEDLDENCVKACYQCLLSYRNQPSHRIMNRHEIRDILLMLKNAVTRKRHENLSYQQHYERLRSQADSLSRLEKDFLDHLYKQGRRLPDEAQKLLADYQCRPDFFYRDGYVCVFCDGSIHDDPAQKAKDTQVRGNLEAGGFRVIVIRYDQSLDEQIETHKDVFGVASK